MEDKLEGGNHRLELRNLESIPRQVHKKSGGPQRGERGSGVLGRGMGVWNSQRGGRKKFSSTFLGLIT